MGRAVDGGVGLGLVAELEVEADIAGDVVVELRCVRIHGLGHIDQCRQGIDIGINQIHRILGLQRGLGHHDGDDFTHMLDLVHGNRRSVGAQHVRAVPALEGQGVGDWSHTRILQVLAGIDREDARSAFGFRGVDAVDDTMADRRPQKRGIGLPLEAGVVGIGAVAHEQPRVLAPRDML